MPVFLVAMTMAIVAVMPLPVGVPMAMIMVAVMGAVGAMIVAKVIMAVLYDGRLICPDQEKPIG
jgi:hypothetical protein